MYLKIYMTKLFKKWLNRQDIEKEILLNAVREVQAGLVEVKLGSFLYKKRIPLFGRGKSSGARTLIAYKKDDKFFFLHGFAKNERSNISKKELNALSEYVNLLMSFNETQINKSINCGELTEIIYEK